MGKAENMEITRIDTYQDSRFPQRALFQHGCFLVGDMPYAVEIVSDREAVIRGADPAYFAEVIELFRFYAPHITCFYDENRHTVQAFPPVQLLTVGLDLIQPTQFYVDTDKIAAVAGFLEKPDDIIIQVLPQNGRYLSLDGHTRLYYAVCKGWKYVRAVAQPADAWAFAFAEEARKRNVHMPGDMVPLGHTEYVEKWNHFCDAFFGRQ